MTCRNARFLSFAHQFEARYDEGHSRLSAQTMEGDGSDWIEMARQYRPRTYVRDICVRCGETIERRP